jgi:hypothetical protein
LQHLHLALISYSTTHFDRNPTPSDKAVLSEQDDDRDFWLSLSAKGLANAYGPDEPEYSLDMIKEFNPEYEVS